MLDHDFCFGATMKAKLLLTTLVLKVLKRAMCMCWLSHSLSLWPCFSFFELTSVWKVFMGLTEPAVNPATSCQFQEYFYRQAEIALWIDACDIVFLWTDACDSAFRIWFDQRILAQGRWKIFKLSTTSFDKVQNVEGAQEFGQTGGNPEGWMGMPWSYHI